MRTKRKLTLWEQLEDLGDDIRTLAEIGFALLVTIVLTGLFGFLIGHAFIVSLGILVQ